ncbi:MAG TPA: EamA family transporter [Spirochaetaceae bacterium]|nr:EamA family transporter [Spirochaetaceae bacterium]
MSRAPGVALALASALSFSTLGLFAKLIYGQGFSVPQTLAWRFTVAAVGLWAYLLVKGHWRRPFKDYRSALLLGVFGFSPQAGLYFLTVRYLNPGLTGLLLYLYPAFVVLFSALFLKKAPRAAQIAALALSLAGCVLTLWTRGSYPLIGYVYGLAVALSYAAYLTAGERVLANLEPVFATACVMGAAALVYWLITIATGNVKFPTEGTAIVGLLGVAVMGTLLPVIALFAAMRRIGASDTALVSTVEPLATIGLSAWLLGERLAPLQWAGGALILCSVLVLNVPRGMRLGRLRAS